MSSDATDALADFASGVRIKNYFATYRDAEARRADLATVKAQLSDLQGLDNQRINALVPEQLPAIDTALALLDQYANEPDAAARQALAEEAIERSDTALDEIRKAVFTEQNVSSPESLAYGFGALHYAMLVRMTVADVVQDGPFGAPGLLETLTQVGNLLFDSDGNEGVFTSLLVAIGRQFEVVNVQGTSADSQVSYDLISPLGEIGIPIEVARAPGEADEEFLARTELITEGEAVNLLTLERENIGSDFYEIIGRQVTQFLAADRDLVPGLHERIGTEGNDEETGTDLADYFSGLGGDDLYFGGAGPDALSGGAGNDILRGGAFQDVLVGGDGNDVIFGNASRADRADGDVARFAGLSGDHRILGGDEYAVVIGPDGSRDKVFDVSYLRFDDGDITLQAGNALATDEVPFETLNKTNFDIGERVALLYEAALNRNGNIDLPGLNFYVDVTARDNLTDEFLAADLMTSQEFTDNFGDANTLSNQAFLEQIYLNVLDRQSDQAGLQFYLDLLNDGTISKALALADIAVSPENTTGSAEILQSLYETTTPEVDAATSIALDWSFVS